MKKNTPTDYKIHNLIKNRWSPRAFSGERLTDDQVNSMFEAARWAPSSFNEQPWRFIYAKREDEIGFNKILSCLVESNQEWAKNASLLVLTVARLNYTHNSRANNYALYELGQAVANLAVQATSMDLYLHQMAGFSEEKAIAEFSIPADFKAVTVIALGAMGDFQTLSEELQKRELSHRSRKPVSAFSASDTFEELFD